ncbi:replicative DNA helicase [Candidatus Wolfebacteria bacterium CG03_land_8_20_14_0_80_36_15]|uniref:Replicative DNA helicase n=1 Tax=Candidatus Wolfebacteria bacterium CG03_land_8_20_14_0_80_36_15 TaxID=1975067 RepID=A0A2M7B877_9BACT|nr:MAG: replicative DNA helicase [Candidatus Wolfebacteria bacterium CG03_land_8_20_14_0_80_36_15]
MIRLPPQDIDAEKSVLGALMLEPNAIIKVADVLLSKDFYKPEHQTIFQAILELFEKSKPIDILSVTSRLKEKKQLKDVGGSSYLTELVNSVPTTAHINYYADLIKKKSIFRGLITASSEINEKAFVADQEADEFLDEVERKIFAISQESTTSHFSHIKEDLKDAYERIEKLHQGERKLRGVSTGFEELDNLLSGFQKSDLIVLGARPSFGKTALALDIVRNIATKENLPVGFFSLEMSREQIVDRLIAAEAQVALWKLRTGRLTDDIEFEMIQEALDRLSKAPLFIDDTPSPNILEMRSMARRLQIEHGLSLLVIDYLQLIQPRTVSQNMVQQVTEISRGLKSLARELNTPILAVSQLSRAVEQREMKIPRLSDLRESGSIEQEADLVLFIYRKDRDRLDVPFEEQNMTEILISKHRNGPLGAVKLRFDLEKVSFRSIDKAHTTNEL